MVVRFFACLVFVSCWTLVLGCGSRAETKPPLEQEIANGDKGGLAAGNKDNQKDNQPDLDKQAAGKGPKDSADMRLLQGSWTCTLRTIGEKELYPSQGKRTLEIKGRIYGEGTLTLDSSTKPKQLDVKLSSGDDKGKTMKGIYEFRDGDLVWCFNNAPDGPRPTSFDPDQHAKEKHAESIEICIFKRGGGE